MNKKSRQNLNISRTKRAVNMLNKMFNKIFFFNFRGISIGKNCLKPKTAPLTILAIKRGLLCNFSKTLKGCHFMNIVGRVRNFQLLLICKSSKLSWHSLWKTMSKIPITDLNKRGLFFKFCVAFKGPPT